MYEPYEMYERYDLDWDAYHHRCQTGPCFICEIVSRNPESTHHIVFEDEVAIAFLDKYPKAYCYIVVAPREHKEQVTGDFNLEEYLELQRRLFCVTEAVRRELGAERMYFLSLGSNQGNSHVHWHVIPLPPGVPYREQQLKFIRKGILKIPEEDMAELASRIRRRIGQMSNA